MKVFAPGKIVMAGAYAVLEGAPAIVVATSFGAIADGARRAMSPTIEVRAALGDLPAPHIDASALFVGDRKLGLGASAAILVSSLAVREAETGADLASSAVRERLLERARSAHAHAQSGGSGVDVAGSLYGGVLRYKMGSVPERCLLPRGTVLRIFACGTSARTTELRGVVARLSTDAPSVYRARMSELETIAERASHAIAGGDLALLVDAVSAASEALGALGRDAQVEIIPSGWDLLAREAILEGAAFCVGGAGGGDVALYLGASEPSPTFLARAQALGLFLLDATVDEKGVRVMTPAPYDASAFTTPTRQP